MFTIERNRLFQHIHGGVNEGCNTKDGWMKTIRFASLKDFSVDPNRNLFERASTLVYVLAMQTKIHDAGIHHIFQL